MDVEGLGVVFLEAAASGLPVVAGDSGGAADAVEDGVTGMIVRHPHDSAETAAALASLLDDADRRARQGAAGRERAVTMFDYDILAAQLNEALR